MTSTPALEAAAPSRPVPSSGPFPYLLFALAGFSAMLEAQSLEFASLAAIAACLVGLALGAMAAGRMRTTRPALVFGGAQFAAGALCAISPALAPLAAVCAGGSFIWAERQTLVACLAGALAASVAGPLLIAPIFGLHVVLWIAAGTGALVCAGSVAFPFAARRTGGPSRRGLAAAFGAGLFWFASIAIWRHVAAVTIGSTVQDLAWVWAAILLGLLIGAAVIKPIRWPLFFPCAALLLTVQLSLWDRVPAMLRAAPTFAVALLLFTPLAALAGSLTGRVPFCAYALVAGALGGLSGLLLAVFALVPVAGSEISLKAMVLVLAGGAAVCLRREPLTRPRAAIAAAAALVLLAALLGKWWNWGLLTASTPPPEKTANERYLPPSLVFQHEDMRGGFTTVVEQTVVRGEVGHTVRALFANGRFLGDDGPSPAAAPYAAGTGSALLIGLGTGTDATALEHAGYADITVAEFSPGVVMAARRWFSGANEGILEDPHVRLYLYNGRDMLLAANRAYDLIVIASGAPDADTREFYQLARTRLKPNGTLQESLAADRFDAATQATLTATVASVFRDVRLRDSGREKILIAADFPLSGDFPTGNPTPGHPPINTDANRVLEFATR